MNATIENTVGSLFHMFEARGIRYAVLRNYELFPAIQTAAATPHTDVDLVVDSRDLNEFRAVLAEIAEEDGWDLLTECDHWAQSKIRHHNIEVFRFSRACPLEYLQVDVFHGVLVWGLPVSDEQQMLAGRIHDYERGLTRLNPLNENIHRVLQIHGLYPGARRKRTRYREKLLAFRAANREEFDRGVRALFSGLGVRAVDALERHDSLSFQRHMSVGRLWFALRFALRHPGRIPSYLISRLRENIQRYFTRQCGAVVPMLVRDEAQRQTVREIMDELVRNSFMDEWREHEAGARVSLSDHVEMEQGAIIIEWSKGGGRSLDLRSIHDRSRTIDAILRVLAQRHRQLYVKAAQPAAHAVAGVAAR